ncbi:MAG: methylenetetrahydrofolate reductase [NAD(P)H] [Gammaproteobacteria bacterium RIFCSPLOWO2_02_FULL_42_14]|nr:MAG: methylenetetrahydrofolate reductase [NAD(P)H] [Gammaproteobacteria bacterium RIFCSPHIGHO2_02_FULL_42_43]OGT52548.1 MAG: methylenetetrahydrofolate reductase [NAD(P)H] [Gammaproteobacteria bacterium RIFCSPHIGHO2_12_FULL_41_25]OGT63146.1 MAG: methylenetetrahydrofolate reductase [NAD(P)H] [Gammaproteobacteria bacterium RIFCSPLOWO2_02_FULL_42_14]OGT86646.1 MAG: methylenetetrahydrofolate reductase [NAD(P)H] [Gammaproteobacteria bacterium RIFCSPLOWO2_12_FULL_42_18]
MQLSFEFFPPKTDTGLENLIHVADTLSSFQPEYFSVTYGAGGSAQTQTMNTVNQLRLQTSQKIVPHISCVGATKNSISALLNDYQKMQIKKLVVLRGDATEIHTVNEFPYATDLIYFIRETTGAYFNIDVAVYPECHPQSSNLNNDLLYFKKKVEAGANGAITQYFYDANAYDYLLENCARLQINIPIVPGIMPITNVAQLQRFSALCGAELPKWLRNQLDSFGSDETAITQFGVDLIAKLCEQLKRLGAPGLHFYTLNKAQACIKILEHQLLLHSHVRAAD